MERSRERKQQITRLKNSSGAVDKREKWNPLYTTMAFNFALLGFSELEMAKAIGVDARTITRWKASHPDFKRNLQKGKDEADSKVAGEFYKNCFDRDVYEQEAKIVGGKIEIVEVRKHIKGDSKLIMRWLSTRQREHWSTGDKVNNTNNIINVDLRKLNVSFEELKLLEQIAYKPITEEVSGNSQ